MINSVNQLKFQPKRMIDDSAYHLCILQTTESHSWMKKKQIDIYSTLIQKQ